MIHFDTEELLKIAQLSSIALEDDEIDSFRRDLQTIISYAAQLDEVAAEATIFETQARINIFREDKIVETDPASILSLAPQKEDSFFVVPSILKQ